MKNYYKKKYAELKRKKNWNIIEKARERKKYAELIYILVKIFKIYLKDVNIGKVLLLFQDRKNKNKEDLFPYNFYFKINLKII
jgi:hypothetical protein